MNVADNARSIMVQNDCENFSLCWLSHIMSKIPLLYSKAVFKEIVSCYNCDSENRIQGSTVQLFTIKYKIYSINKRLWGCNAGMIALP